MKQKTPFLKKDGTQTILSSLVCVILGLVMGYIVLLLIEPSGAWQAIMAVIKNFFTFPAGNLRLKNLGNTLVKTAPLILCSLSVLFAYKVGLFNIGVAGQYVIGAAASLYCALILALPWYVCLIAGIIIAAISGAIVGLLRAFCNVNVVISGIMLNWISLYCTNMVLYAAKDPAGKDTETLSKLGHKASTLPQIGLQNLFAQNKYVSIAIPITIVVAIIIWIILDKTKLGYELKATGNNLHAAKYCGMKENRNIILTMAISGALAGMGAGLYYLSDFEPWNVMSTAVPAMGFNGIAAAFLGGLHPIGAILSSLFIQHISLGGGYVDLSYYCAQIADLISSVIIYLCGFVLFFKLTMNKFIDRREESLKQKAAALLEANTEKGGKK